VRPDFVDDTARLAVISGYRTG